MVGCSSSRPSLCTRLSFASAEETLLGDLAKRALQGLTSYRLDIPENHDTGTASTAAAESWARTLGLTEMASDADLANAVSIGAHRALGYTEAERIVCFRKEL